jgi:hypothetical protein
MAGYQLSVSDAVSDAMAYLPSNIDFFSCYRAVENVPKELERFYFHAGPEEERS